jgi:large subunit ribosomal protein L22
MAKTQEQAVTEVRAQAKWVRCSVRKARPVLDTIRGRTVPEARTVLAFSTQASAREIDKVLRSAVANAEANHRLYGDEMVISACYADEGPRLKRWKPRARGRADRFHKPSCHITIKLAPLAAVEFSAPPRAAVRKTKAPPAPPVEAEETKPAAEAPAETAEPSEEPAVEAKSKAPTRTAMKPRVKKADKAEAKPASAPKRKPRAKKAEE